MTLSKAIHTASTGQSQDLDPGSVVPTSLLVTAVLPGLPNSSWDCWHSGLHGLQLGYPGNVFVIPFPIPAYILKQD